MTLPYPSMVFVPLDVLTAEELNQMVQNTTYLSDALDNKSLCNKIYPVGSVMIRGDNVDYSDFLGGTWQKFASGTVLVGMNASDSDFNTVGKTGGSKTQELRAAIGAVGGDVAAIGYISENPIPGHTTASLSVSASVKTNTSFNHSTPVYKSDGTNATTVQPYTVVNYWKRVG